jgi:hypothetical protein
MAKVHRGFRGKDYLHLQGGKAKQATSKDQAEELRDWSTLRS